MSTKSTAQSALKSIDISKMSEAELDALMAQAAETKANRLSQAQVEKENRLKAVGATFDAFHISVGKALGHEITKADAAKSYGLYLKGQLNKVVGLVSIAMRGTKRPSVRTVNNSKAKRLTDETKAAIKLDMMNRGIRLKLNQPNDDTINLIAKRHDVSPQTVDNYRPTTAEINAEINKRVTSMATATAPVAPATEAAPASVLASVTA